MAPIDNRNRAAPRPPPPPPPPPAPPPAASATAKTNPSPAAAFAKGVTDSVGRAPGNFAEDKAGTIKSGVDAAVDGADGLKSLQESGYSGARDGVRDVRNSPVSQMNQNYAEASKPSMDNGGGLARQGVRAGGLGVNALSLGSKWGEAGDAWGKAGGPDATANDRAEAVSKTADATKTTIETANGVAELTRDGANALTTRRMNKAFDAAAPDATKAARSSTVNSVGNQVIDGATNPADIAKNTVKDVAGRGPGAKAALREGMGEATNREARTALKTAATKAAEAGLEKTAAKTAAKAAGRFVPGANVAIAAVDTANAAATLASDASVTKKVTSVVTAVGSIAAATNIPVVSQVGGAVSSVSDFVGGLFG